MKTKWLNNEEEKKSLIWNIAIYTTNRIYTVACRINVGKPNTNIHEMYFEQIS